VPVFVSWSGTCSKQYAEILHKWVREVVPGETVFYSPKMQAGSIGLNGTLGALEKATFGVLCLTPDNLQSGWLHFEAGALLNNLGTSLDGSGRPPVVPLLCHGLLPTSIDDPLKMLQAKQCDRNGLWEVAEAINISRADRQIEPDVLRKLFDLLWDELSSGLSSIKCDEMAAINTVLPKKESDLEILTREVENLKQLNVAAVSASSDRGQSSGAQRGYEFTELLRARAERSGHVVQAQGDLGPDLLIDGRVIIEVKVIREPIYLSRRIREGAARLERWKEMYPEAEVVLALVGPTRGEPFTESAIQERGIALIWSPDGKITIGNPRAQNLCSYLLDGVASSG
jgi:hypothetical protein